MKKITCLMLTVILAACGGGGGGYSPACLDSAEGCTKHIPTSGRGNSSNYLPSDNRGETNPEPSEDRGDTSERDPTDERGDDVNYVPSTDRGNDAENIVQSDRGTRPSRGNRNSSVRIEFADESLDYSSLGKELGLSYSDFGTYEITNENEANRAGIEDKVFVSGNATQKIDVADIVKDVQFSGRAVGGASADSEFVKLDGDAVLNFDKETGVSTLGATFDNWYDIIVKDDAAGTIEFSNYKNKEDLVKFDVAGNKVTTLGAEMDVGYYGARPDMGIPSEAVGNVKFQESVSGIKMDVAFGVK